jgi:hypothetical protein
MMMRIESTYDGALAVANRSIGQGSDRAAASIATKASDSIQLVKLGSILNALETDSSRNIGRHKELHEMLRADRYRVDSESLSKILVRDMLNER